MVTFLFHSFPFERRPLLHVRRSVSVLLAHASAIICWACFADVSKIKGQLVAIFNFVRKRSKVETVNLTHMVLLLVYHTPGSTMLHFDPNGMWFRVLGGKLQAVYG